MSLDQSNPTEPFPEIPETITLTLTRDDYSRVVGTIGGHIEDMRDGYANSTDELIAVYDGLYRKLLAQGVNPERANEPASPHARYRELLREIADLRYPDAGPVERAGIEDAIDRKVTVFLEEQGGNRPNPVEQLRAALQRNPMPDLYEDLPPAPAVRQPALDRGFGHER